MILLIVAKRVLFFELVMFVELIQLYPEFYLLAGRMIGKLLFSFHCFKNYEFIMSILYVVIVAFRL